MDQGQIVEQNAPDSFFQPSADGPGAGFFVEDSWALSTHLEITNKFVEKIYSLAGHLAPRSMKTMT